MNIKEVMNSVKVKIREDALDQKIYSDAIDEDGNQYIDIVMEDGGVLGKVRISILCAKTKKFSHLISII
ncbi:hypothetical protein ACK306_03780 [Aeromonas caviae]